MKTLPVEYYNYEQNRCKKVGLSNSDTPLILVMSFIFLGLFLRNATVEMTFLSDGIKNIISTAIKMSILFFLVISLLTIINRIKIKHIIGLLLVFVFIGLHIIVFENNNIVFYNTVSSFITTILPGIICLLLIYDYEKLYNKLILTSRIIGLLNIFAVLIYLRGFFKGPTSMGYSMNLIIPTCFLFTNLFYKKRKYTILDFCLIGVNFFAIFKYGSRGSLIAILLFFAVFYVIYLKSANVKNSNTKIAIFLSSILLLFLFLRFLLQPIASIFGISNRSLNMLLDGSFFEDNGRSLIWSEIMSYIKQNPYKIRGINADQLLKTGLYQSSNTSHNLVIEMVYSFGVVFGSIICLFFFWRFIKTLRKFKSARDVVRIVFLFGFFPICFWSGSIWVAACWWFWIIL